MTTAADHLAQLLRDAKRKRDAAEIARGVGDRKADEHPRREARYLEEQADALDPRHLQPVWHTET